MVDDVRDFGVRLTGVAGVPDDIELRIGVDEGEIIFVLIDATGEDLKHCDVLLESDFGEAIGHLMRARTAKPAINGIQVGYHSAEAE